MITPPKIVPRPICSVTESSALAAGLSALQSRLIAARVHQGEASGEPGDMLAFERFLTPSLRYLDHPDGLPDITPAAERIAQAVINGEKIGVVTDYDVDGITSHTFMRESLTADFGMDEARVSGFIGHRLNEGYGLSDPVCERILAVAPAVIITADCGSSDEPRIKRLKAAGIDVIVTDHHGIPLAGVPASAMATVSPARDDSDYPDAAIAGCAVAWLLMCAVRQVLIDHGHLPADAPKLTRHLDLVALGTVADAVSLFSHNNRALVSAGLTTMNRRDRPCWIALAELLERNQRPFVIDDLGYQIGPRINARGRMEDPFAAWHFLAAATLGEARHWLQELDQNNLQRRATEKKMVVAATARTAQNVQPNDQVVLVFDDDFHAGVQGIVASRLVERFGRVTCVLSPGNEAGVISGSLRSVPGVDVSAALQEVCDQAPQVLEKFGGHPAAAGVTLQRANLAAFKIAFADAVRKQLGDQQLQPLLFSDGPIPHGSLTLQAWQSMQQLAPFGRGFDKPLFDDEFEIIGVRTVGADPVHLSLNLRKDGQALRGIWFNALPQAGAPWPLDSGDLAHCVFELEPDSYRGGEQMQLMVRYAYKI